MRGKRDTGGPRLAVDGGSSVSVAAGQLGGERPRDDGRTKNLIGAFFDVYLHESVFFAVGNGAINLIHGNSEGV